MKKSIAFLTIIATTFCGIRVIHTGSFSPKENRRNSHYQKSGNYHTGNPHQKAPVFKTTPTKIQNSSDFDIAVTIRPNSDDQSLAFCRDLPIKKDSSITVALPTKQDLRITATASTGGYKKGMVTVYPDCTIIVESIKYNNANSQETLSMKINGNRILSIQNNILGSATLTLYDPTTKKTVLKKAINKLNQPAQINMPLDFDWDKQYRISIISDEGSGSLKPRVLQPSSTIVVDISASANDENDLILQVLNLTTRK